MTRKQETAIRVLHGLATRGIVRIEDGKIILDEANSLRAFLRA